MWLSWWGWWTWGLQGCRPCWGPVAAAAGGPETIPWSLSSLSWSSLPISGLKSSKNIYILMETWSPDCYSTSYEGTLTGVLGLKVTNVITIVIKLLLFSASSSLSWHSSSCPWPWPAWWPGRRWPPGEACRGPGVVGDGEGAGEGDDWNHHHHDSDEHDHGDDGDAGDDGDDDNGDGDLLLLVITCSEACKEDVDW